MWQDKLKEIIYILENSDINEIDINFWGRKYRVVKSPGINVVDQKLNSDTDILTHDNSTTTPQDTPSANSESANHNQILSPMPGTFYSAPSPEAEPFVKAGDAVKKVKLFVLLKQ